MGADRPRTVLLPALALLLFTSVHVAVQAGPINYDGADFNNGTCSNKKINCADHSTCVENPEHTRFKCYCPDPFEGDGYTKTFKGDGATGCKLKGGRVLCRTKADCHPQASCEAVNGTHAYVCVCKSGYTGNGAIVDGCKDVNECKSGKPCAANAICKNRAGSFDCHCDAENHYVGDGFKNCTWVCYNLNDCKPYGRCVNKKCTCPTGFLEDGRNCTDINECDNGTAKCPKKSTCVNSPGSYKCICNNGYEFKNNQCIPYHKTCDEIFKAVPGMISGQYKLDFDGEGPLPVLQVQCVVKGKFAITEVTPSPSFPLPIPSQGDNTTVKYPVDLRPLVNNSDFCTQKVWIKCSKDYNGGPVQWEDMAGNRYTGFGGSGTSGKCACGEVGKCPGGCYCGKGGEGEDGGLIILQGALPVSKVILPRSSGGGTPGTYYVGKLRCGPQNFDIPKNCQDAKFNYSITKNGPLLIDMDGTGPAPPVLVYCNQEAYSHVGIIELPPDKLEIKKTTTAGEPVGYSMPGPKVTAIIEGSVFCSQRVEYRCQTDTRTAAGVQVTTRGGLLTYFPGGSKDKPGSCPCEQTKSCDSPKVQCNCDISDGRARSDFGLIIDKTQLPVLSLRTMSDNNTFTLAPLQCSQKQFGIEPNCEKLRQNNVNDSYSYTIDPDGPEGSEAPFTVECEMEENEGVTVVNNEGGSDLDMAEGKVFTIKYLQSTPAQLDGLKFRSTVCVQEILFANCPSGSTIDIASFTYNGGSLLSEQLNNSCPGAKCPCGVSLPMLTLKKLPVYNLRGSSARMTVGPLKCKEIYPDCESYDKFVKAKGVEGEKTISRDTLTIDPDGPQDGRSLVVQCRKKVTIIDRPSTPDKPVLKIVPGKKNPGEVCWQLNYTDAQGNGIGAPQMAALMKTAKKCAQTFKLTCSSAMGTGMVSYKNCAGKSFTNFVSGEVEATCACGATGTCIGGPDKGCNCDTSGTMQTTDLSWVIANSRLPICEVCMKLHDINGSGAGVPDFRSIKFEVSKLQCGKKQGRKGSCQMFRQEGKFNGLTSEKLDQIWMDTSGKPVLVGCQFNVHPPTGEMIIRPTESVFKPGENITQGKITIVYRGFQITAFKDVTSKANYCTQDILFFCAADIPDLTGSYGLYSDAKRLSTTDYELRDLSAEKASAVCSDARFAALCGKCGRSPKRLVVSNKAMLPLTTILLPKDSSAVVAVLDVACAYVEQDCEAIRSANKIRSVLNDGYYVIDPDQQSRLAPFKVKCEFDKGGKGVTRVPGDPKWVTGQVGGSGGDDGADFKFTTTYPTATPEQINSLVQNSDFCWQGVKYKCQEAPLAGSTLIGFNNQSITGFGTADDSNVMGCACKVLGTCKAKGVTCNCDATGSMVDQGAVTDKKLLPVTGFNAKYKPNGQGNVTVTDVRCAPAPIDPPRDCAEAYQWKKRYGIDYSKSGEYLISPAKVTGTTRPFLVYCNFTIDPTNPITVVKPKTPNEVPVGENNTDVPYQGPNNKQLKALVEVSAYCYQQVKVDCYSASFIQAGVRFITVDGTERAFWSSGSGDGATCTCGSKNVCGGTKSKSQQQLTKCNCDIGDKEYRSDAAILDVKKGGPLRTLVTKGIFKPDLGQLNLTVGNVFCAQKPIEFKPCETGFQDCARMAQCVTAVGDYRCECPSGWRGKVVGSALADLPTANGRQCIDDDECTMSKCPYSSVCKNLPGSYYCDCKPGYRQVTNFTCEDIDECKSNDTNNCDVNARCINTDGSYVCRCLSGYRGTGQAGKCYKVGQCICFGDPHCESFDGRWSHYQGLCSYVMAGTNCGNSTTTGQPQIPKFLVATRNWDHNYVGTGEYSWVKEVYLEVHGKKVVLGQGSIFTVDGQQKQSFRLMSPDNSKLLLSVTVRGTDIEVYTDFGLEVLWDGDNEVTVYAPTSFSEQTCGMCGNFNRNPDDDWQVGPACPKPPGQTTTREPLFGNSWTLNTDTCSVNCDPPEPVSTCDMSAQEARQECGKMFANPAFAKCIKALRSEKLYGFNKSCEYDLCHSNDVRKTLCNLGTTLSRACTELLTEAIDWKRDEMCATITTAATTVASTSANKNCSTVKCADPKTHCVKGECVCKMGYVADCNQCVDVDECAVGEHDCKYLGQKCVNTDGSYQCNCLPGFKTQGKYCKNINECDDPKTKCPGHSECHDFPGGYECVCCAGYVMKDKECIRNPSLDNVYGAPGNECCACTGKPCSKPQPVCGTDGKTYPNFKVMVVKSCRQKTHVEVNYPGPCKGSCEKNTCTKPFQVCTVKGGVARCKCPSCGGGASPKQLEPVCASNKKIYPSQCEFQLSMCETNRSDVTQESSMEPCVGKGDQPVGPWSEWTQCSNKCGKGKTRRVRQKYGNTSYPLQQEAACYTVCDKGPCHKDFCRNPGQVCQQNVDTGKAECVCPDCEGQPDSPVCGLVGRVIRTYDSHCLLKQKACELIKNHTVLENRACEDKPVKCGKIRNYPNVTNANGCISLIHTDVGACYGGCGKVLGQCCLPVKNNPPRLATLAYRCPDGTYQREKREKVTACECRDADQP